MRVISSFVGGAGHFLPQLPLLRALAGAGHELTLVGRASAVRSAPDGLFARIVSRPDQRATPSGDIAPLIRVDIAAELAVVTDYFAGRAARASADALSMEVTGADLVICDELDFGAMAAADRAGVPVVVVAVIASGALVRPELIEGALRAFRAELALGMPTRPRGDAFVVPFAPAMRNPAFPAPDAALWMRPETGAAPDQDGSIVVTLGTEFNSESGDLFDRILASAASLNAPTVVAVGRDLDPGRFGEQPSHIRIEQYVDLAVLLPRASVVLHHGGSGLFMSSILGGAPQIVFPMGADQPFTAERVEALGIGRVLDSLKASPAEIRATVKELLTDAHARANVLALRADVLTLPPATSLIPRLEEIVQRRRL